MRVIFLTDVKGAGRRHEEKDVSDGYARNFLIPRKFAVPAGTGAARDIEAHKIQEEKSKTSREEKLSTDLARLAHEPLIILEKANEKDHLFASLNAEKIARIVMNKKGINLDPDRIVLESPIKELGAHRIGVKTGEHLAHFTLEVRRA